MSNKHKFGSAAHDGQSDCFCSVDAQQSFGDITTPILGNSIQFENWFRYFVPFFFFEFFFCAFGPLIDCQQNNNELMIDLFYFSIRCTVFFIFFFAKYILHFVKLLSPSDEIITVEIGHESSINVLYS